jgi:hypothetical protein
MAKIKKYKRRVKWNRIIVFVFFVTGSIYLGTSIFLRQHNVNLSTKTQEIEVKIANYKKENEALAMDIQQLINRASEVATDDGMTKNEDNVVYIGNEE